MFRASVKVVSIFSTIERLDLRWYFPLNCDRGRQQASFKCVGWIKEKGGEKKQMLAHCCRFLAMKDRQRERDSRLRLSLVLTSQMSLAALQISASVLQRHKQLLPFLKSQHGLLGENSNVNVKASKGMKMVFIKEEVHGKVQYFKWGCFL